jgi:hypothetical protein
MPRTAIAEARARRSILRKPCYRGGVPRKHIRFALGDVTFAGEKLPNATMDCWVDRAGNAQWIARVVTRSSPTLEEGELSGKTPDGRVVSGHVLVNTQVGPGSRRETMIEFHGSGVLKGLTDSPT